jgi:hypothetical protein
MRDRQVETRFVPDSFRSPEIRDYGPFVLINCVKPAEQTINGEETEYAGDQPEDNLHGSRVIKELQRRSKPE